MKNKTLLAVISLSIIGGVALFLLKNQGQEKKSLVAPAPHMVEITVPITVKKHLDFSFELVDGATITKIINKRSGTEYRITLAGDSPWCYSSEEILNPNVNNIDSLLVIDGKFNEDNEYFLDYFRSLITQDEIGTDQGTPQERDKLSSEELNRGENEK